MLCRRNCTAPYATLILNYRKKQVANLLLLYFSENEFDDSLGKVNGEDTRILDCVNNVWSHKDVQNALVSQAVRITGS